MIIEKNKNYIAHIGFGAFHRGHQAYYTQKVNALTSEDWRICVVSLFSRKKIEELQEQNYRFSVLEKGISYINLQVVEAISEALHPDMVGIEGLIDKLAEEKFKIISLTLTEKGYCISPQSGKLDIDNELIKHDLENPHCPQSAIGVLVAVCHKKMERNLQGFTILSCDNISENGHVTRNAVLDYAQYIDKNLQNWIKKNVSFPNTMVDRIVPAMTEEGRKEIEKLFGEKDCCGVICEEFTQWVVEDDFVGGRPAWEKVGVQFVDEVLPYEEMKLRMLNGSHSFLAYVGSLMGYSYIDECMEDERLKKAVQELMINEQAKTLNKALDVDINAYAYKLLERFSNANIKHKILQIAMDGSQKLPHRAVASLNKLLNEGEVPKWIPFLIAAWMVFIKGKNEKGQAYEVVDPLLAQIQKQVDITQTEEEYVEALLRMESIFGPQDSQSLAFISSIKSAYQNIVNLGITQALYKNLK